MLTGAATLPVFTPLVARIGKCSGHPRGNGTDDSVQAFEFPDREPVAVSQPLELNGTVTALWTSRPGDSAIAVYRDSDSGNYEAVQLTLTCGQ